jgi:hypothetical protein
MHSSRAAMNRSFTTLARKHGRRGHGIDDGIGKSTDQSGVSDEQRVKCDLLIEDRRP